MTGTDLVQQLVNPASGEVVATSDATDILAQERRSVIDLKRSLDQYAAALDGELVRRLDRMGQRSANVGGWQIETKAPTSTDYPVDQLRVALEDLIDIDLLDDAILNEVLVSQPVTYKLNRQRLNTLLRHPDERVRAALEACAVEVEQRRSISVKEPAAR